MSVDIDNKDRGNTIVISLTIKDWLTENVEVDKEQLGQVSYIPAKIKTAYDSLPPITFKDFIKYFGFYPVEDLINFSVDNEGYWTAYISFGNLLIKHEKETLRSRFKVVK